MQKINLLLPGELEEDGLKKNTEYFLSGLLYQLNNILVRLNNNLVRWIPD